MPDGVKAKLRRVIKCYFCNFDGVWSKRENEKHDILKLSVGSNFPRMF
jgi:hypothetical protein